MTWVFTALVTACGQAWADFDMYMPEGWAKDPQRRRKAGIPEALTFATKPELAVEQLNRLMAAGVRALWAAADEVYGRCGEFRDACRALSLAYVVIISCDYKVTLVKDKVIRADEAISDAVFERRSCGNGTKGPRYSDWAFTATADPREYLLIRRLPWREKNQYALGWDQSQARTWDAICRHTALTALAQLRTAAIRGAITGAAAVPPGAAAIQSTAPTASVNTASADDLQFYPGDAPLPRSGGQPCPPGIPPIGLSDAETARIERLARDWKAGLLTAARLAFRLRWSRWRRGHQARARWHHYSTRLQALAT